MQRRSFVDQCWSEQMLFNTKYDFLSLPLRLPCEVLLGLEAPRGVWCSGGWQHLCSAASVLPPRTLPAKTWGKSLCPAPNTATSSMQGRAPSHPHPNHSPQITPKAMFTKHRGPPNFPPIFPSIGAQPCISRSLLSTTIKWSCPV